MSAMLWTSSAHSGRAVSGCSCHVVALYVAHTSRESVAVNTPGVHWRERRISKRVGRRRRRTGMWVRRGREENYNPTKDVGNQNPTKHVGRLRSGDAKRRRGRGEAGLVWWQETR
eukprot:44704-Pyramimonas_sp.AAC.1